jgi:hypothetical protein
VTETANNPEEAGAQDGVEPARFSAGASLFWAAGVAAAVLVVVMSRISRSLVQPYGVDGAEYIEHLSRLEVLQAWREVHSVGNLFAFLREADNAFPPLLHILTLPIGAALGHRAEDVLMAGPLWLLLLAAAIAMLASALGGGKGVAAAAGCATLLVPALHGFATRYYYDLPMTALLWLGLAVIVMWRGERPLAAGAVGGLLLFAAALVKWLALPFAVTMLVGVVLLARAEPLRARLLAPAIAAGLCAALVVSYLLIIGPHNSLVAMLRDAASSPAADGVAGLAGGAAPQEPALTQGLIAPDGLRLLFYPLRLVSSVLSPLMTLVLLPLAVVWLRRGAVGFGLVAAVAVGQGLFLLLLVPPLDDRFLLVMAPALALVAALGWQQLGPKPRRWSAVLAVLAGMAVALDFHTDMNLPGSAEASVLIAAGERPGVSFRGLGLADSVERRGWSRLASQGEPRFRAREQLWTSLDRCDVQTVRVASEDPMLGDSGDLYWFHYRSTYAALEEEPPTPKITMDAQPADYGPPICRDSVPGETELAVSGVKHGVAAVMPPCIDGQTWGLEGRLSLVDLQRDVAIWSPKDRTACPSLQAGTAASEASQEATGEPRPSISETIGSCEVRAAGLELSQSMEPDRSWRCEPIAAQPEPWQASACNADYLQLSRRTDEWALPVDNCKGLHEQLAAMWEDGWDQPRPPIPDLSPEALRESIRDTLNISGLMDGDASHPSLDARSLSVVTIGERESGGYKEWELVFEDPFVGTFHGLLLVPPGEGPFPAVLALPGHGESAAEHRDNRYGWLFPEEGYAVLILTTRAYDTGPAEHEATLSLLCGGFSTMTVRVYEALLALKFLRGRSEICNDRIGLIGHSGGSIALNLLVRLWPHARAYVSDLTAIHFNVGDPLEGDEFGQIGDETHPGLARLSANINDFETLTTPILAVPYGYADGPVPIFEFFAQHMGLEEAAGSQGGKL